MNLEDYRDNQLVGEIAFLNPYFNGQHLHFLFHDSSNAAFFITKDALNTMQLHNSIGGSGFCMPGVGLWFQATESYISTLYKLAVAESQTTHRGINKKACRIVEKMKEVNGYFGLAVPTTTIAQLQEFGTFRNGIFHDLCLTRNTKYSHTLFSPKPEKLNEVDVIQAARVAINIFSTYRYVFKGMDLMPQVWINNQFADIDRLAEEVLYRAFKELLNLKGLGTALDLSSPVTPPILRDYDIRIAFIISNAGPDYPNANTISDPSVVNKYFKEAEATRPIDPTKFGLPNYTRNKLS